MFFTYNQNNSGGSFTFDDEAGISHFVIVEADDNVEADDLAERIGLYFDGCDKGWDCDCCGDRWYPAYDGSSEPEVYGRTIVEGVVSPAEEKSYFTDMKWMGGPEGYIHFKDGRVEAFDYPAE